MHVINSLELSEGVLTRNTVQKGITEAAVLDYFIVSDKILPFVKSLRIDETKVDVLTKFATKKGVKSKVESDHNLLICELSIEYSKEIRSERIEIFDLKDEDGLNKFYEETDNTTSLSSCFDGDESVASKIDKFKSKEMVKIKTLPTIIRLPFSKWFKTPLATTICALVALPPYPLEMN